MRQILSYEELSRVTGEYLRPGVTANVMVTREKFESDIKAGCLFLDADEHNLWIMVRREGHVRLYFYLNDLTRPLSEHFDRPAAAEIAFRAEAERLAALKGCLALCGLRPVFRRLRLTRPSKPRLAEGSIDPRQPSDTPAILDFLESNFSPLTGCLPTLDEVLAGAADKRFLAFEDEAGIAGLIHVTHEKNGMEIRHLAVRKDRRGQGLADRLVAACLKENPGKICRVWVREDYGSAGQVYAKAGFEPDGWRSLVWQSL